MKKSLLFICVTIIFANFFISCNHDDEEVIPNTTSWTALQNQNVNQMIEYDFFKFGNNIFVYNILGEGGLKKIVGTSLNVVVNDDSYFTSYNLFSSKNNNAIYFTINEISGSYYIYKSTDGSSFNLIADNLDLNYFFTSMVFTDNNFYTFSPSNNYPYFESYSISGNSISNQSYTIYPIGLADSSFCFYSDNFNYYVTCENYHVYKSNDIINWSLTSINAKDLENFNNNLYYIDGNKVYKIDNNGISSLIITVPNGVYVTYVEGNEVIGFTELDPNNSNSTCKVYYSNDLGQNWNIINVNINMHSAYYYGNAPVNDAIFDSNNIYIATIFGVYFIDKP